jgi:hypothetical protein
MTTSETNFHQIVPDTMSSHTLLMLDFLCIRMECVKYAGTSFFTIKNYGMWIMQQNAVYIVGLIMLLIKPRNSALYFWKMFMLLKWAKITNLYF